MASILFSPEFLRNVLAKDTGRRANKRTETNFCTEESFEAEALILKITLGAKASIRCWNEEKRFQEKAIDIRILSKAGSFN